jgi:hypothetical protein
MSRRPPQTYIRLSRRGKRMGSNNHPRSFASAYPLKSSKSARRASSSGQNIELQVLMYVFQGILFETSTNSLCGLESIIIRKLSSVPLSTRCLVDHSYQRREPRTWLHFAQPHRNCYTVFLHMMPCHMAMLRRSQRRYSTDSERHE